MPQSRRFTNTSDLEGYIKNPIDNHSEEELLTQDDEMEEFMFLGLRKMSGVDVMDFQRRFGVPIENVYAKEIEHNIDKGLLIRQGDMLKLTEYGIDICNTVMSDFILTGDD